MCPAARSLEFCAIIVSVAKANRGWAGESRNNRVYAAQKQVAEALTLPTFVGGYLLSDFNCFNGHSNRLSFERRPFYGN